MSKNSFTILGSGSGFPQAGRATSGGCIKYGDSLTLLDCGGGVTRSFLSNKFDPLAVRRIIISHTHSDHVCELTLFLQLLHLSGNSQTIELYLPSEFVSIFNSYLKAVYIFEDSLPFDLKVIAYAGELEIDDGYNIKAVANKHLSGYADRIKESDAPNKMQAHSFHITTKSKKLFHTVDIFSFDDIKDHIQDKDYLIFDSTHVDLSVMLPLLPPANIGKLIATHITSDQEAEQIKTTALKAGINNLEIAYDGMVIEI